MKVALLGPVQPYRGGIAHYTTSLFGALSDAGHDVAIYNFTRQYPDFLFPGKSQKDVTAAAFEVPNERVVDTLNPLSWLRTARRIARTDPDHVVVQWWHPYFGPAYGSITRALRRHTRARITYLCHNVLPHESSIFDRVLCRYAYGSAHAFMVQAAKERDILRGLVGYGPRVEVAPHPVYDVFAAGEPEAREVARDALGLTTERVLLFFGYIRPYKGLATLLEALPELKTTDYTLVIAGECYEDKSVYTQLMDELGVTNRVRFIDRYISNEEVPRFFAAADLVALPYKSATQSGIVQVAYAFGVPVVVTAVGGIPEVVDDGESGLLVPPEDPRAFAAAIDRFYDDDLAATLRAGVIDKREAFGWERVVEALGRCARR